MENRRSRRNVLALSGTALAAALAGCTGDGDDGGGDGGDGGDGGGGGTSTERTAEEPDQVIEVGPGGDLVFEPAEASVAEGATVEWVWRSDFHSVTPESQPEGENWDGTGTETHDEGYTHVHTFATAGTYEYYCEPHRSSGMTGTLTVGSGGSDGSESTSDGGDGGTY